MLSKKRYEEVKAELLAKNTVATEEDFRLFSDYFEIMGHYTHDKLTTEEMMRLYLFFCSVLQNECPEIVKDVQKQEVIRVLCSIMDEMSMIKEKLDREEKQMVAFCIYISECTHRYDEDTQEETNGITFFESTEMIDRLYRYYKTAKPDMFTV